MSGAQGAPGTAEADDHFTPVKGSRTLRAPSGDRAGRKESSAAQEEEVNREDTGIKEQEKGKKVVS